jgi:hypothetical protein
VSGVRTWSLSLVALPWWSKLDGATDGADEETSGATSKLALEMDSSRMAGLRGWGAGEAAPGQPL